METFADLPDALVRDLLAKAMPVAESVSGNIRKKVDMLLFPGNSGNTILISVFRFPPVPQETR